MTFNVFKQSSSKTGHNSFINYPSFAYHHMKSFYFFEFRLILQSQLTIIYHTADQPMSGNFRIAVTCAEGLAPYVDVRGNFKRMKPKFAMTPSSISASLTRGKQYTFMVGTSLYCFKHLGRKLDPDN